MSMTDGVKIISDIENRYGLVLFRMGLSHLADVGMRHLTDEFVEECVKQIIEKDEAAKSKGSIQIMSADFQCEIVRCAAELAKCDIWDIFYYVKGYVHIAGR